MNTFDKNEASQKMNKTIASFKKDLGTLRTGRANPAMLDLIRIDVYGEKMPINQLATVTVPEPRTISIQVWDKNNVKLSVGHIERFNPVCQTLAMELKNKRILNCNTVRISPYPKRISDVGVKLDLAIHDIDLIKFFL